MWMVWETRQWTCIIPPVYAFQWAWEWRLHEEMQDKDKGTHNKDDDHELMCVCVCVYCCIIGGYSIENVKEQVIKWSGRETNGKRPKKYSHNHGFVIHIWRYQQFALHYALFMAKYQAVSVGCRWCKCCL